MDNERDFELLCRFEKKKSDIFEENEGLIRFKGIKESTNELGEISSTPYAKTFSSYKELFENEYKESFKQSIRSVDFEALKKELPNESLKKAFLIDTEIKRLYDLKERDLDGDGVPDRIDIDDKNNAVQTVSDLSLVANSSNKAAKEDKDREQEQKKKKNKSHAMEL